MQGIPIDELIVWNEKLRRREHAAVEVAPEPGENIVVKPDTDFDELAFIKGMESDFACQAEGLLETLHLSHLRAIPQK